MPKWLHSHFTRSKIKHWGAASELCRYDFNIVDVGENNGDKHSYHGNKCSDIQMCNDSVQNQALNLQITSKVANALNNDDTETVYFEWDKRKGFTITPYYFKNVFLLFSFNLHC